MRTLLFVQTGASVVEKNWRPPGGPRRCPPIGRHRLPVHDTDVLVRSSVAQQRRQKLDGLDPATQAVMIHPGRSSTRTPGANSIALSLLLFSCSLVACGSSAGRTDAAVDAPVDGKPVDAAKDLEVDRPPADGLVNVDRPEGGPAATMSFFVTSTGTGAAGGNLGGLAGADKICQDLAAAAGAGNKTWHAYLSTEGQGAVNARDRIGSGPWYNYLGIQIAANLAELHGNALALNAETALDEKGARVPGSGSPTPPGNQQDILTGSRPDGTAFPGGDFSSGGERTCMNWTFNTLHIDAGIYQAVAQVGHFDRTASADHLRTLGGYTADTDNPQSWNSAHASAGCDPATLGSLGSSGRLYCFATN
jgi:hypothetical protein